MVKDQQVRLLMKELRKSGKLAVTAAKAGMCEKTARKYRRLGKLPSEVKAPHNWRTRENAFEEVWPEVREFLKENEGLEAKTLFEWLQREQLGRFADGQLRTFQRRVKVWRATEGSAREVDVADAGHPSQVHEPGRLAQSDFTHLDSLRVTIQHEPFPHMIYHFVLTFSNWETGTVCFSERFRSASAKPRSGGRRANLRFALAQSKIAPSRAAFPPRALIVFWRCATGASDRQLVLGGQQVGQPGGVHRPLPGAESAIPLSESKIRPLLAHYRIAGLRSQPGEAHENGDVEQRHHRFKRAADALHPTSNG